MKLEGTIRLEEADIKQAIAGFLEREYGLAAKVAPERIGLYSGPNFGVMANVDVGVAIIDVEPRNP